MYVLRSAGLTFDAFDRDCAAVTGAMWREYRASGGKRTRLSDFESGEPDFRELEPDCQLAP
jgi:hypothetical protein